MTRFSVIAVLLLTCLQGQTQDIFTRGIVYQEPGMNKVTIQEHIVYSTIHDTSLSCDIYYPPGFDRKKPLPLVLFNNGAGGMEVPRWGVYRDWAKLIAANGMIAVNHQSRRGGTLEDGEALIDYLAEHADQLSLDANRMAIWTCSANTPTGLRLAFKSRPKAIRAAVQYYGSPDSLGELRQDLPLLIVRAGKDAQFINNGIDNFLQQALEQDIRVELINYLEGIHAFDVFTNSDESRSIIQRTVTFLRKNLTGPELSNEPVLTNKHFNWMLHHGQFAAAVTAFRKARETYRADSSFQPFFNAVIREDVLNVNAYTLLQQRRVPEALQLFQLLVESYPGSANAYESLSEANEVNGDTVAALTNARRCLELLQRDTLINPQFRDVIRNSARARIDRLEGKKAAPRASAPPPRAHHELVFDDGDGTILMTAGSTPVGNTGQYTFFNDLWRYDGSRWKNLGSAGDQRSGIRMAYDTKRKKIYSFGGYSNGESLGDLRVLENGKWRTLSNDTMMRAAEPGFVYDSRRDRLIAFGGSGRRGNSRGIVWEWTGDAWKTFSGNVPPSRQAFAMVYDQRRGKTILYGGMANDGTQLDDGVWEYDGRQWKQYIIKGGPGPRISPGVAYDAHRGLLVLFGGISGRETMGDTWAWNGIRWERLATTGPAKRTMGYMAYDKRRDRIVLFGGRPGWPDDTNDTWQWDGAIWTEIKDGRP